MVLGKVKSFTVSYDCLNDSNVPVFSSGDCVSGRVIIEVTGEIRVKSLKIHAKGFAKVRWTESRNAGSNTAYTQNYTEEVEYLNHRDILIGHERGKECFILIFLPVEVVCKLAVGCCSLCWLLKWGSLLSFPLDCQKNNENVIISIAQWVKNIFLTRFAM